MTVKSKLRLFTVAASLLTLHFVDELHTIGDLTDAGWTLLTLVFMGIAMVEILAFVFSKDGDDAPR